MTPKETDSVLLLLAAQGDPKKAAQIAGYLAAMTADNAPAPASPAGQVADGVYLVLNQGRTFVPFTGQNSDDDRRACTGIGVKLGSKSLVVALDDIYEDTDEPDITLTTKRSPNDYNKAAYLDTYEDAGADWDGKANTERLKVAGILNPVIADRLKDGEYVPAMGQLLFVHLFRKQINAALRFVGGKELVGLWYWTSTECSAYYAWRLYLSYGYMDYSTKASSKKRVRPVSAFIS